MPLFDRRLEIEFNLGKGSFGLSGFNTVTLKDLRATAKIDKAGGNAMGTLDLMVYGMTRARMDQLNTLGTSVPYSQRMNTVTVFAVDEHGKNRVFSGSIHSAWTEYQSAPQVAFHVVALTNGVYAVKPADAVSAKGTIDAVQLLEQLAKKMNLEFENNGVENAKIENAYYSMSLLEQVRHIVADAGIHWNGGEDGVLAIWPKGGNRTRGVVVVSPKSGLVGYPTYAQSGIKFRSLYNPGLVVGGQVELKTDVIKASKKWVIYSINIDMSSLTPNGSWFMDVSCVAPGQRRIAV